jgi:hypothetical protein
VNSPWKSHESGISIKKPYNSITRRSRIFKIQIKPQKNYSHDIIVSYFHTNPIPSINLNIQIKKNASKFSLNFPAAYFFRHKYFPLNLSLFPSSCRWRGRRWATFRHFSSNVYRVPNAKKGWRLVCFGRAKAIAAVQLVHKKS